MAKLKNQLQSALDESRILILGTQVLPRFQFSAAFEQEFARLPDEG